MRHARLKRPLSPADSSIKRKQTCALVTADATTANVLPRPKRKPPRLERIFQKYDPTLFFVTFNVYLRRPLLASPQVHAAFVQYGRRGFLRDVGVGRYVLMPDHVHLFVQFGVGCDLTLGEWMKGLKRCLAIALLETGLQPSRIPGQRLRTFWQPGVHDHVLRNEESYAEKWNYVRDNPVRAGLVLNADDWPYGGEIVIIDRL